MKKTSPWIYIVSIAIIALVAVAPIWTCRDDPVVVETVKKQYDRDIKEKDAGLQEKASRIKELERSGQDLEKKKQTLKEGLKHVTIPKDDAELVARFNALGYHPVFK